MPDKVLELRIHGVSGTPPSDMLGVPRDDVAQVAGDKLTGFFRCPAGKHPHGGPRPDTVAVEAYSWGRLTSGLGGALDVVKRVAWLTLLPFALGNVAYWARAKMRAGGAIAMRLASLLLTLMLVGAAFFIGADMVAWQCFRGGGHVCESTPSLLGFLDTPPWDSPTMRVLVGSLLPLVVLMVLFVLSGLTLGRYEAVTSDNAPNVPTQQPTMLRRARMWQGSDRTGRLRWLHAEAGCAYVVTLGTWAMVRAHFENRAVWAALLVAAVATLVAAAVAVALSYKDGLEFPGVHGGKWLKWLMIALRVLTLGVITAYGIALVMFADQPRTVEPPPIIAGHDLGIGMPLALLVLIVAGFVLTNIVGRLLLVGGLITSAALAWLGHQVWPAMGAWPSSLLAVAVLAVGYFSHRKQSSSQVAWGGATAAMLLGAAVWIATLFTTSAVVWVGDYLNGGQQSVTDLRAQFDPDTSPGTLATGFVPTESQALIAQGSVTVINGDLAASPSGAARLVSGELVADQLFLKSDVRDGRAAVLPGVDIPLGVVRFTGPLSVVDSRVTACKPIGDPIACEQQAVFMARGFLSPPDGDQVNALVVDGQGTTIHLDSRTTPQEPLVVPEVVTWFSWSLPLWLLCIVGLSLWLIGWWHLAQRDSATACVRKQLSQDEEAPGWPAGTDRKSERMRLRAAFAHRAERIAGLAAVVTVFVALVMLVGISTATPPWADYAALRLPGSLGLWLCLGVSLAIIALAAKMRDSEGVRRTVGILWDISTFWPRVAHPLGPPCYAERVVPEVVDRLCWALDAKHPAGVIVSAHSQGSAIAVAALHQIMADPRRESQVKDSVRLITYGSQIRMWFGRIFPAVFGPEQIGYTPITDPIRFRGPIAEDSDGCLSTGPASPAPGTLVATLNPQGHLHWINLYRRTDPIGFRVLGPAPAQPAGPQPDRYVSEYSPGAKGDPCPALHTHSRYQFSQEYETTVRAWYHQLARRPRPPARDDLLDAGPLVP